MTHAPKAKKNLLDIFKKMQTGEGVGSISEVAPRAGP